MKLVILGQTKMGHPSVKLEESNMNLGNLSRRGFMEKSVALYAAMGFPLWYSRELSAQAANKADVPNGPVMAAIGIGSPKSRGNAIYNDARRHKAKYVAACDVESNHLARAVKMMKDHGYNDAQGYKDFRQVLDRKDIEAVTIATPDHWHALIAIEALRKGKDVYCEKPLTLTIEEALKVMQAAEKYGKTFQTGSQQRSDKRFRLACELVRNGRIGKIQHVECRIGTNPVSGKIAKAKPPETLDWDFWLGPTPMVDYLFENRGMRNNNKGGQSPVEFTNCHYEFRWFYDYSGGKMTDWGAHHIDIAQWGLGMDGQAPATIEGSGEKPYAGGDGYNTHPKFRVNYTYANGIKLVVTDSTIPETIGDKDNNGILFVGENKQWIFVNRGKITASDPKILEEPLKSDATRLEVSDDHMGNFMECRRTGKKPICNAGVGGSSVIVCHLGAVALRLGRSVNWDHEAKQFVQDDAAAHRLRILNRGKKRSAGTKLDAEANAMISRPVRKPWKLEV